MRILFIAIVIILAGSFLRQSVGSSPKEQSSPRSFALVSPPSAVNHGLHSTLSQIKSWVNDKDYVSAAQTARQLAPLAQLYDLHGSGPTWMIKIAALRKSISRLQAAIKEENSGAIAKRCAECRQGLGELTKLHAGTQPRRILEFQPFGSTKTWMLLMEEAFTDTKNAKTGRELELLALLVAEECNVVQYLRKQQRWKKMALAVQRLALDVAIQAKKNDVKEARVKLKMLYERCEACHNGYRR